MLMDTSNSCYIDPEEIDSLHTNGPLISQAKPAKPSALQLLWSDHRSDALYLTTKPRKFVWQATHLQSLNSLFEAVKL
jgi:hypothetical protein